MRKTRNQKGGMALLTVTLICVIFIPIFILITLCGPHFLYNNRVVTAVDGAGIVAANALSKIVINDPAFGYVSLSNYAPIGRATCASDGESMAVTGINTLMGTCRQNAIIANELRNETMTSLLEQDLNALAYTIDDLNGTLRDAISENPKMKCYDIDGNVVCPMREVREYLEASLPPTVRIESLKLSLGWLKTGSTTTIPVPQPMQLSQLRANDAQGSQYSAFTPSRVGNNMFTFAGLGTSSALVSKHDFQPADGKHISSIVQIECIVALKEPPYSKIESVACCQPYSNPDQEPGGAMTIRFSQRPITGLMSWNDFLSIGNFRDNKVTKYSAVGGDYPLDKEANLQQHGERERHDQASTSREFAKHLYYWLRNGHTHPRLDAILAMLNEPFRSGSGEVYTYEFQDNGSISRNVSDMARFPTSVVADGQNAAVADPRISTGASPVIIFRDNVGTLGTNGGKHGGQALAGYPLKSSFFPETPNNQLAAAFSQRKFNPRGLALDIEIGGTGDSPTRNDMARIQEKCRFRKI